MPNVDEILGGARDAISARRVYGDPIETEEATVLPAAAIGGGGGGGGDNASNGGAGFGLRARPVGAWVIRGGEAKWKPAVDVNRLALYGLLFALIVALRRRS
jgi:uncharacterized spore protein YtfJ